MFRRIGLTLLLAGASASATQAQGNRSADSLVTHWIKRGALADWQPHLLFAGCPNLQDWQRRGVELLLAADLTPERTSDLALAWMIPLRECHSAPLEQWYFEHIDAAIQRGESEGKMLRFWTAMRHGDSPAIRDYLRNLMVDVGRSESYRNAAGVALFVRFTPEERLRQYLRAFETRRMPFEISVGQTAALLEQDADGLLREVGTRVRLNPAFADQLAFTGIVESSPKHASLEARRNLGEALQAGLNRPGLTARQRSRLEGSARFLMQRGS
jgi:hypothetical protein